MAHLGERAAAQLRHRLAEALVQGGGPAQALLGVHSDAQGLLILTPPMRVERQARQRRRRHAAGRAGWAVGAGQHIAAAVLAAVLCGLAGRHRPGRRQRHRRRRALCACIVSVGRQCIERLEGRCGQCRGREGKGEAGHWEPHTRTHRAPGLLIARTGELVAGAIFAHVLDGYLMGAACVGCSPCLWFLPSHFAGPCLLLPKLQCL